MSDNNHKYYGKYCFDHISDDHEGLDVQVRNILSQGLISMTDVHVGVLSFSNDNDIPTYSSEDEIKFFDYYYTYDRKIYVDGKLINKNKCWNKLNYANILFEDAHGNKLDVIVKITITEFPKSINYYKIQLTKDSDTHYEGKFDKQYYRPDFILRINKITFHKSLCFIDYNCDFQGINTRPIYFKLNEI
jgi:hypothetical protein